jgi:hypothetical protein
MEVPLEDTTVQQRYPHQNFSDALELRVSGSWEGNKAWTLIQPDLGGLSFDVVSSAILTLTKVDVCEGPFCRRPLHPVAVRPVISAWEVDQVTWWSRPETGDVVTSLVASSTAPAGTTYAFDITDLVNAWLTGEIPDRGLAVLVDSRTHHAGSAYASLEMGSHLGPQLLLTPAPEPGTALLLALGLALLSGRRWSHAS